MPGDHARTISPLCFHMVYIQLFADVPVKLCSGVVASAKGIQFCSAPGTLQQYDQYFPGIDHKSCTLSLYHLLGAGYDSSWSWWPSLRHQ